MTRESNTTLNDVALRLVGVHKRYGRRGVHALRGVSLDVARGECFGLLGPNGAGKTTLMKLLMTTLRPTAGQAWLLGRPIGDRSVLARVGYVPESFEFPPYLTPRKLLDYAGRLAGVSRSNRRERIGALLDMVGMAEHIDAPIKRFSKGMTQRVALAQALVHKPDLLFLDEPTDGLDPVGRAQFRDLIRQFHQTGVTVFLNSHLLNEVEQVCTQVAVLSAGQVVRVSSPESLVPAHGLPYSIRVAGPTDRAATVLASFHPRVGPEAIELDLERVEQVSEAIDRLRAASILILEIQPIRATLEEQFLQLLGDPTAGQPVPVAMPLAGEAVRP